jgi:pimeloyl-ACP methyl ester carboxylesterase
VQVKQLRQLHILEVRELSESTFVLVHGAWHDGSCWAAVANILRAQGHAVITPDLPGHGSDKTPLTKVTFKSYVTSLIDLLGSQPEKTVLVGHSMSGMVITEVASRLPQKISQLVYVSAYLPRHDESVFDLITLNRSHEPFTAIELAMQMSADKRSCTIEEADIIPLFYHLAPLELATHAKTIFGTQATLPLAAKVNVDQLVLDAIPSTYISCSKDKVIPLHHQRRMLTRRTCNTLLQIETDHSPFYSAPAELAAVLAACTN